MKRMIFALLPLLVSCSVGGIDYQYKVTGTAKTAIVTYSKDGAINQVSEAKIPFSVNLTGYAGDYVSVSAQNLGEFGSLVVEIVEEGRVIKSGKAEGAFGIASASGSL